MRRTCSALKVASLALSGLVFLSSPAVGPAHGADVIETIGDGAPAALQAPDVTGPEIWKDPSQPLDARVQDLVRRMSLAEKASQLRADAAAIPRLGIPSYSYRNEGTHGVAAKFGFATVFPQVIGMAATWDASLIHQEADVIATEGRAHFNDYALQHEGNSIIHEGISFYAPNINIVRDPRWGRGQETYGEDPFLTAQLSVAYIRGLQGDDPKYVKAIACAKHFAVHSGPEDLRKNFNATPPERDLYDTYLPAFEATVREGQVGSVMASYNALDGVPNCANPFLLTQVLRRQWGFQGFVVSDGGALRNLWQFHKYVPTAEEAAAVSVKAGCDLFSSNVGGQSRRNADTADAEALGRMLQKGLLSEKQIDQALSRTLAARFRLGLFDPPSMVPWSNITLAQNDTPEHRALALKVAEESIVLLKNDGLLPLNRAKLKRIAVVGRNAEAATNLLLGNYNGIPSHPVTILDGIKQVAGPDVEVTYAGGCPLALKNDDSNQPKPEMTAQAVAASKAADVVIYVGGLDASLERESATVNYQGFDGGDRTQIELPAVQEDLLKALKATGKPVVFVCCSGSAIAMPWEAEHLPAIVQAWYPGEQGGRAVAEVLFGEVNPAGRLPLTFYRSTADLPSFEDYSMSNRTYRYFSGKPLFAFGYGLSYTKFRYNHGQLDAARCNPKDTIKLAFDLQNSGNREGDEVAQVYFHPIHSASAQTKLALCGFARIHLAPGQTTKVALDIPAKQLRHWDIARHQYVVEPGDYELLIGGASSDIRLHVPLKIQVTPQDS